MWLNKIKTVFIGPSGLRGVWRVLMALAAYLLWTTLAAALLTLAFAKLFNAWGVNTLNLRLAPAWTRAVVNIYPYAISLLVNIPAALIISRITRKVRSTNLVHAAYFPIGMAAVIIPTVIFLLTDSLRAVPTAPAFHWAILMNLPVCMAAAWAEQSITRDLIPSFIKGRFCEIIKYAASALSFFVITKAWEACVIGALNLTLMACLLLSVTMAKSSAAAIALRAGWMWASASIFGMTDTEISLVPLYPVSEKFLTGGAGGMICGLITTLILTAALIIIHRKTIKKLIKKTPAA